MSFIASIIVQSRETSPQRKLKNNKLRGCFTDLQNFSPEINSIVQLLFKDKVFWLKTTQFLR